MATGEPTTAGPTSTNGSSSGETGPRVTTSGTGTTTAADTSAGGTTGAKIYVCEFFNSVCEENEHCTPEARLNAEVTGDTPLGPFTGTFAYANMADVTEEPGTLCIVSEYQEELGTAAPRLRIDMGGVAALGGEHEFDTEFVMEAPVAVADGQGNTAETIATVHVSSCCERMNGCGCYVLSPYEVSFTVTADGWALTGKARPNCCRSFTQDEAG